MPRSIKPAELRIKRLYLNPDCKKVMQLIVKNKGKLPIDHRKMTLTDRQLTKILRLGIVYKYNENHLKIRWKLINS
jgi:hypothetical protein